MRTRVDPASSEFSRSSFTTEAGRSTTSPAAILLATASERTWILPMALDRGLWSVVSLSDDNWEGKGRSGKLSDEHEDFAAFLSQVCGGFQRGSIHKACRGARHGRSRTPQAG